MKKDEFNEYYKDFEPIVVNNDTYNTLKPLTKVRYDPNCKTNKVVSQKEAIEDINIFFRIMELCYCGYEYYRDKIDFNKAKHTIISSLSKRSTSTLNIGNAIYKELSPYINDSHFSLLTNQKSFANLYKACFTGIVTTLLDEKYLVVKGNKLVKKGYVFSFKEVKDFLFETLPDSKENKRFLLGVYTDDSPKNIKIGEFTLAVHPCKIDNIHQVKEVIKEDIIEGIPIVHNSSYSFQTEKPTVNEFFEMGKKYSGSNVLIWSVLSNIGGNSNYPMNFIKGLNNRAVWSMDVAIINNPLITEGYNQEKRYSVFECPADTNESQYKGTLFILQNKKVASSGEAALMYGKSVKKSIFVGSASMGCGQFGDMLTYKLPNSQLYFAMGYKVFNMDSFEEGKGIYPDYWLDSKDPVRDVVEFIKRRECEL